MRKYWAVWKTSLENTFAFRMPILIWRVTDVLSLVVMASFWMAALAEGSIGGYSKGQLITYYLLAMVISPMVSWHPTWNIKKEIVDGQIGAMVIVKPMSYYWFKFFGEFGWHMVSPLLGVAIFIIVAILLRGQLVWALTPFQIVLAVPSVILAAWLTFSIAYSLGLLAFWLTEVEGLSNLFWMGIFIFGGQVVPLSFFSGALSVIARILPFRYVFSFPLEILVNKLSGPDLLFGFLMQCIWILVFGFLGAKLWSRGLKIYSAYGN